MSSSTPNPTPEPSGKSRDWVFTWFYKSLDDIPLFETTLQNTARYYFFGKEIAPTTGRPHLQGHVVFKNPRCFRGIVKEFQRGICWNMRRGTLEENDIYCSKDGDVTEWGNKPTQGKRTDIISIRKILDDTPRISSIIDSCSNVQQIRFAELYLKYHEPGRSWKPIVYWFFGDSGAGKTRHAVESMPQAYISSKNLKWWDGYDGHEDVIIDDFRKDFCTFHELLRILDRYAYRVETKGGSRQLLAKRIIITSNLCPLRVYDTREDVNQLLRRIDKTFEWRVTNDIVSCTEHGTEQKSRGNIMLLNCSCPSLNDDDNFVDLHYEPSSGSDNTPSFAGIVPSKTLKKKSF